MVSPLAHSAACAQADYPVPKLYSLVVVTVHEEIIGSGLLCG